MAIDIADVGRREWRLGDEPPLAAIQRAIGERWSVVPPGSRPARLGDIYPLDIDRCPTFHDRLTAIRDNVLALAPFFLNLDDEENASFCWSRQPWYFDRDYIARTNPGVLNPPRRGACWGLVESDAYATFLSSAAYWLSRFRYRPAVALVAGWWSKNVNYSASGGTSTTTERTWIWSADGTARSGGTTTTTDDARTLEETFGALNADEHFELASEVEAGLPISISGSSSARRRRTKATFWDNRDDVVGDYDTIETYVSLEIGRCPQGLVVHNPAGYAATALLCFAGPVETLGTGRPPLYSYRHDSRRKIVTKRYSVTDGTSSEVTMEEFGGTLLETVARYYPDGGENTETDYTYDGTRSRQTDINPASSPQHMTIPVFGWEGCVGGNHVFIERSLFHETFGLAAQSGGTPGRLAVLEAVPRHGRIDVPIAANENGVLRISADADPVQLLAEVDAIMPSSVPSYSLADASLYSYTSRDKRAYGTSEAEISMSGFGVDILPVLDYGDVYRTDDDDATENWAGIDGTEWDALHPSEDNEEESE